MSETLNQARTLLEEEKFAEALELLHTVTPVTSLVKASVGRALSGLSRYEEAHALFCEIIEEDKECHEAFASRGLLYFLNGQFDKAQPDFEAAVEGAPMNGRYHGLKGVLLAQMGDGPGAIKSLESAYDMGAHDAAYLLARAQIHLAMRDLSKATLVLELAEKHGADAAALAALEGALNLLEGKHEEALASYRFSVEKAPENEANWMNMLTLTAKVKRDMLLSEAKRALKAHPESDNIILLNIGVLLEHQKVDEAFQMMEEALERNPKNPRMQFQMGLGLAGAGKFEKAIEHLTLALDIEPRFPRALDARGNCRERLGRTAEAQEDFKRSHAIRQEDAEKQAVAKQMVAPSGNGEG